MTDYTDAEVRDYAEKLATQEVRKRGIIDADARTFLLHYLLLFRRYWFEAHTRGDFEGYGEVVAAFYQEGEQ